MWFVLECPDKVNGYHKDDYLKRIFKMVKLNPDSPNPTAKPQRVDINIDWWASMTSAIGRITKVSWEVWFVCSQYSELFCFYVACLQSKWIVYFIFVRRDYQQRWKPNQNLLWETYSDENKHFFFWGFCNSPQKFWIRIFGYIFY